MRENRPRSSHASSPGSGPAEFAALDAAIRSRRKVTDSRLQLFATNLKRELGVQAPRVIGDHTCVYVVGSGGRGELSPKSDLDLFLVRHSGKHSRLDAVLLQAAIVKASSRASFPEPSGDGEWLTLHTADRFVALLGSPEDDSENTFTARMLLLLESRPVLGHTAYEKVIASVVRAYWRNEAAHQDDYHPIVLLNDIVRYWRILLLNYEAKNVEISSPENPETRDAKRRLRSYKLRFSRCLTCYSALTYLLALTHATDQPHVTQKQVRQMVAMSPLERLLWVRQHASINGVDALVERLLQDYLGFLDIADLGKTILERQFRRPKFRRERSMEGKRFGEAMFELVCLLGRESALFRWLIV